MLAANVSYITLTGGSLSSDVLSHLPFNGAADQLEGTLLLYCGLDWKEKTIYIHTRR